MALAITAEHRELADSVRSVLADRHALADARAALDGTATGPPAFWPDARQLGWLGLHVAERFGGEGHSLAEAVVVLEQLGAQCAPGAAVPTMLASAILQATASEGIATAWLPRLSTGAVEGAVALTADLRVSDGRLDGAAAAVLGSEQAALFVLPAGPDLVVVDAASGLEVTAVKDSFDPTQPLVSVRATGAPVAAVLRGAVAVARRLGWLFAAATASGGMAACLEASVGYVRIREQFGRPVGSFQAVKHHCANLLVARELASAAVWDAARSSDDAAEAELTAAVAATLTLAAFVQAAQQNIQLHGGIGYTWEHDAHLYLRRATALAAIFGPVEPAARAVYELRNAGTTRRASVDLPPEADRHRAEARAFVARWRETPPEQRQSLAAHAGYVVPHWPAPYGRGADAVEQIVIDEELREVPRHSLGLGEWVLPTILQHGNDEQLEQFIWPSLEGTLRWCQLFSEPGAGSDAAAVSTRARRTDGGWLVSGQKVWTSQAHVCQMGLATVRTDPDAPKHAGITAMAIEMDAPGVDVRPLTEITGEALFNEVFFDDVFVPDGNVIGQVGGGWKVARATLANERLSIGSSPVTLEADALIELLGRHPPADDGILREAGTLLAEAQALRALNLQQLDRALSGAEPGVEGNIAKIVVGEHAQRVVNLGMRIAGPAAVLGDEPRWAHDFLFTRCLTIAGGTSEVVRTQIAERILALPREPGL